MLLPDPQVVADASVLTGASVALHRVYGQCRLGREDSRAPPETQPQARPKSPREGRAQPDATGTAASPRRQRQRTASRLADKKPSPCDRSSSGRRRGRQQGGRRAKLAVHLRARAEVMSEVLLDAAGRRRSPATMPGFRARRPPRDRGLRYPADPPTIEEIVSVM